MSADDLVRAFDEGRNSMVGDRNPYAGVSLAQAKMWLRGYQGMLKRLFYEAPSQQPYVAQLGRQN